MGVSGLEWQQSTQTGRYDPSVRNRPIPATSGGINVQATARLGRTRHGAWMSLYQLVRETLEGHGGRCSRAELLRAILADTAMAERLARSQGFVRLLDNMKYSGFIEFDEAMIRRTARKVGRRHV